MGTKYISVYPGEQPQFLKTTDDPPDSRPGAILLECERREMILRPEDGHSVGYFVLARKLPGLWITVTIVDREPEQMEHGLELAWRGPEYLLQAVPDIVELLHKEPWGNDAGR
jgi:hypothetical protein